MSDRAIGVGFDVDHTIAIDNKLERVAFLRLLEQIVDDGGRMAGTLDEEIARIDDLLAAQRGGAFSIEDAVRRFAVNRGVAPSDEYVARFTGMALGMVAEFVIPLPGARQTFAALRARGIAIAVLSNGWNPLQVRKARRAGFEGPVLASADLGVQKPHRAAFSALCDVLGTPAEATWYVGDDPRVDVEGARAAGLRSVWLDAEGRQYPEGLAAPTLTVRALEEIAAILEVPC